MKAYYNLLMFGETGELYNICSGKGIVLSDIVKEISDIVGVTVNTVTNPDYVRLHDNHIIIGSYGKIENAIGWRPVISIEKTLRDMVDYYWQL